MKDSIKSSIERIIDTHYSDEAIISRAMSSACHCTGRCKEIGYCPTTETRESAIKRHQDALKLLMEKKDV